MSSEKFSLWLSERLYTMDPEDLEALDSFVSGFPLMESCLKNSLSARDYDRIGQELSGMSQMLTLIHADDISQRCERLKDILLHSNHDIIEFAVTSLISDMADISIDIQIFRHKYKFNTPLSSPFIMQNSANADKIILAVDDVSLILMSLKNILRDFKFIGVTSAASALKYLENHKPDLFLLDIEMPDMNGYDLAEQIISNGHTAPIIFLTGNSSSEYVLKALQIGAADFIIKPISAERVMNKVSRYI